MKKNSLNTRQKKAEITKQSLYDSAITLFKERGYESVHVEDIAELAGTSKGSFYTYFKSKDEVVLEHYKRIDEFYEKVFQTTPEGTPFKERLLSVLNGGFKFSDELGYEFLSIVLSSQLSLKESESIIIDEDRKLYKLVYKIFDLTKVNRELDNNNKSNKFYVDMTLSFHRGLFLDYCLMKDSEITLSNYGEEKMKTFVEKMLSSYIL